MTTRYRQHVSKKVTPQSEAIPGSTQVANSAGGYAWAVDDWTRLDRFLILGAEGGTYYIGERQLTKESAGAVERCLAADGARVVRRVVEISESGRAPKNDPALFVLAMAAGLGDPATKASALDALPRVARIGTHLFHFAEFVEEFRGWGRGLRRAIGKWYADRTPESLALQLVKYQQREGWAHRDLLRLSHPPAPTELHASLYRWATAGPENLTARLVSRGKKDAPRTVEYGAVGSLPVLIEAFETAKTANEKSLLKLIADYKLPMECIPTERRTPAVYEAMLPTAGLTWLFRNLRNLGQQGVLAKGRWEPVKIVCDRLTDGAQLKAQRIHPIQALAALCAYTTQEFGRSQSHKTWEIVADVKDAADRAFYLAFGSVIPAGKRVVLALDVSGSMDGGEIAGIPGLTPRVGAAAMAMISYKTEPTCEVVSFQRSIIPLDLSRIETLHGVVQKTHRLPFGSTDCAQPMLWALDRKVQADAFVIYTDSETWAGDIHPTQALVRYRQDTGILARLVVVGMTSNGFTIADPNDAGMLDVVGFDAATPQILADFCGARL